MATDDRCRVIKSPLRCSNCGSRLTAAVVSGSHLTLERLNLPHTIARSTAVQPRRSCACGPLPTHRSVHCARHRGRGGSIYLVVGGGGCAVIVTYRQPSGALASTSNARPLMILLLSPTIL